MSRQAPVGSTGSRSRRRARIGRLAAPAAGVVCVLAAAAGCGGSAPSGTATAPSAPRTTTTRAAAASRVCAHASRAAARRLDGHVRARVTGSDPAYIECIIRGGRARLDVVAQAVPQARSHYETDVAHQVQVYAEPGGTRNRMQLPRSLGGVGAKASWIPAQHEVIATNGTLRRGGSFVTVTVAGHAAHRPLGRTVARAVTAATLAAAPRGPKPAPPPR